MSTPSRPTATLRQALDQAREQLQQQRPPAELARAIQAHMATAPRPGGGSPPLLRRWAWPGGLACALLLVGSVVLMIGDQAHSPQPQASPHMAGFLPLVPKEDWPQGTAPAWLVQTELRHDRLAALGLPVDPARAGEGVPAELLVRPSGEVLAVRFLQ